MRTPPQPASIPSPSARAVPSPHAIFRRLRMSGFTAGEAGALVAHLVGLPSARSGWAIEEVERLLFVRAMVDTDRMGS